MTPPMVSVVIPARDEASVIEGCIAAVAAQDWPRDRLEVLLADGQSSDDTVLRAREAAARVGLASFRVIDNPARGISPAMNVGLEACAGKYLVRVDARSRIPPSYVRTTVEILSERPEVGVVGGAQIAQAASPGVVPEAIARALRNRLSTGLSRYRRAVASGRGDTVWMGVFRTAELRDLGGWPIEFSSNEDWELNRRFRERGSVVWFEHTLRSGYVARAGFSEVVAQHLRYGRAKGEAWSAGQPIEARQVGLLSAPVLAGLLMLWTGPRRALPLALAGLVLVDHVGVREPAPIPVRLGAAICTTVIGAAWWLGAAGGLAKHRLGLR